MAKVWECKDSYAEPKYVASDFSAHGQRMEIVRDVDFSRVTCTTAEMFRNLIIVENCILPKVSLELSNLHAITKTDFRLVTNFPLNAFKKIHSLRWVSLPAINISGVSFSELEVMETNFAHCKNFTWREFATLPKQCAACTFPHIDFSGSDGAKHMKGRSFADCDFSHMTLLNLEMLDACEGVYSCVIGETMVRSYARDMGAVRRMAELELRVKTSQGILSLVEYAVQNPYTGALRGLALSCV